MVKKIIYIESKVLLGIVSIIGLVFIFLESKLQSLFRFSTIVAFATLVTSIIDLINIKKPIKLISRIWYYITGCALLIFLLEVVLIFAIREYSNALFILNGVSASIYLALPVFLVLHLILGNLVVKKIDIYNGLMVTVIYGAIILFLNIIKLINGPYGFFDIYSGNLLGAIIWLIGLPIIQLIINALLLKVVNRFRVIDTK